MNSAVRLEFCYALGLCPKPFIIDVLLDPVGYAKPKGSRLATTMYVPSVRYMFLDDIGTNSNNKMRFIISFTVNIFVKENLNFHEIIQFNVRPPNTYFKLDVGNLCEVDGRLISYLLLLNVKIVEIVDNEILHYNSGDNSELSLNLFLRNFEKHFNGISKRNTQAI